MFGQLQLGMSRVRAIESWIYESIEYKTGFTHSTTTAQDVFVQRIGTGRDAKDVAFATIFGGVKMVGKKITIDEGDLQGEPGATDQPPTLAVSTAKF